MKKILWMLVVFYGLLPIYGQQKAAQATPTKDAPQKSSAPVSVTVINEPAPKEQTEAPKQEPKSYFGTLVSANNLPTDLLVVVGVIAILFAARTVNATKDAAEAALLNAKAVINAERAWLLFKAELDENGDMLTVSVVNYGRVPARNIEISKPIMAITKLKDLVANPPDYGDDLDDIQEWLAPKESWVIAKVNPKWTRLERFYDAERKKLQLPDVDHITYGQVTYLDGISKERRHSRYCIVMDDGPYKPIAVVGNEVYLECT
jgi:hypothetical protein